MRLARAIIAAFAATLSSAASAAQPAMWTMSDEDTIVHLFGTVHLLPEGLDWRHDAINDAFAGADTFCVETDIIGKMDEVLTLTMREGIFSGDERLSDHLDDEQERDLRAIADALGASYAGLDVQKPWNALFTLSEYLAWRSGLRAAHGVEMRLLPEARAEGKAICEMESPEEHVTSLSRLPIDVQVAALMSGGEEHDTPEALIASALEELAATIEHWAAGDVDALAALAEDGFGHPEFHEAILTRRNRNWIPRIEALLDEPGVKFVAVGAAHLAGPESVVEMLREQGHEVEGP